MGIRNWFRPIPRRAGCTADEVPLLEADYIVLDTELTGLDDRRDSIVSIGALRMKGTRIDLSGSFYRVVKPSRELSRTSVIIHGITPSDLDGKPTVGTALAEFHSFCADGLLVGYCVDMDLFFIRKEIRRLGARPFTNPAVDIHALYEWVRNEVPEGAGKALPVVRDNGLYRIASAYGIEIRGAHNAYSDAYITAQVFQRLLRAAIDLGIRNTGDLLRIARHEEGGDLVTRQRHAKMPHF